MRVLTSKQIKRVEEDAFKTDSTESGLMLNAGTACFNKICKIFAKSLESSRIAVFCGNGKNAGDGFVIADLLRKINVSADIILCDKEPSIAEPKMYYDNALKNNVKSYYFTDIGHKSYDIIVDCIFGIGFHGEPREPFGKIFDYINSSTAKVVSIDTPSGTDSTDGSVANAVKADYTIAISTLKYAHILPPSNSYCGKIYTVNIGISEEHYKEKYANTITKADVKKAFSPRDFNSNKGSFGHELNICGSYLMPGASVICANAALKSGVGLLKCAFPKSIYPVMTSHLTQPIFKPLCENSAKTVSIGALGDIMEDLKWANSVLVGCGLGNNDDIQVVVDQVIKMSEAPIVLDADGINAIVPFIDILKDKKAPVVVTPHPGEMARMIGESVDYVCSHRLDVAKAFAKDNDVIVVLKGANTIVTNGEDVFFNITGNPGMAMGGTGDMLSGIIASFIAQGLTAFDAAKAGVYIHGRCGDICAEELSVRGMTVDDMLSVLSALMSEFE